MNSDVFKMFTPEEAQLILSWLNEDTQDELLDLTEASVAEETDESKGKDESDIISTPRSDRDIDDPRRPHLERHLELPPRDNKRPPRSKSRRHNARSY